MIKKCEKKNINNKIVVFEKIISENIIEDSSDTDEIEIEPKNNDYAALDDQSEEIRKSSRIPATKIIESELYNDTESENEKGTEKTEIETDSDFEGPSIFEASSCHRQGKNLFSRTIEAFETFCTISTDSGFIMPMLKS